MQYEYIALGKTSKMMRRKNKKHKRPLEVADILY